MRNLWKLREPRGRQSLLAGLAALVVVTLIGVVLAHGYAATGSTGQTITGRDGGLIGQTPSAGQATVVTNGSPNVTATPSDVAGTSTPTPPGDPTQQQGGPARPGATPGATPGDGTPAPSSTPSVGPGATPTVTSDPTATPAPTPTSSPDAASILAQSGPMTVSAGTYFSLYFLVQNTGTSTWTYGYGSGEYSLECTSLCPASFVSPSTTTPLVPGGQLQFNITMSLYDTTGTRSTYHPSWSLVRNGARVGEGSLFGPALTVPVTIHGFYPALRQAVPSCDNPAGVTWEWWNASGGNAIGCDSSSLTMRQGVASLYPTAVLTSVNGSYDGSHARAYVHVHFPSTSGSAIGMLMLHVPSVRSQCDGVGIGITPDGKARLISINSACVGAYGPNMTLSPSTDWDLSLILSGSNIAYLVNGNQIASGGTLAAGPYAGLMVVDPSATSSPVSFSGYEFDQWS